MLTEPTASVLGTGVSTGGGLISTLLTNKANRELQEEQWAREDTAHQREMEDLKKAGLNPLLAAAGSGAPSSAPIPMRAPEIGDFGGAFVSGAQAETARKAQKVSEQIAKDTLEVNKKNKAILDVQLKKMSIEKDRLQHDYDLDIERKSRSTDPINPVDKFIQAADAAFRAIGKVSEQKGPVGTILGNIINGWNMFVDQYKQQSGQVPVPAPTPTQRDTGRVTHNRGS